VIHRIRYTNLVNDPEPTIRSLLDFLEEPYHDRCLEPLELRINSSTVPADFETHGTAADPALVAEAMQLSDKVEASGQPANASQTAADEMDSAFQDRVNDMAVFPSGSN